MTYISENAAVKYYKVSQPEPQLLLLGLALPVTWRRSLESVQLSTQISKLCMLHFLQGVSLQE
jgi:hypothetical protein